MFSHSMHFSEKLRMLSAENIYFRHCTLWALWRPADQGLQTTTRGPNLALEVLSSGAQRHFVNND